MTVLAPLSPVITVAGRHLAEDMLDGLASVRVEVALGLVGRATLRFTDPGYQTSNSATFPLGTEVTIGLSGGRPTIFTGTVTGASLHHGIEEQPQFTVVIDDAAYKLTRGTKVTTYVRTTYADVVRTICARHGLTARITGSGLGSGVHEYLLQAGTDMAFLNSIVQRVGYVWWVDGKQNLNLAPSDTSIGKATLELRGSEGRGAAPILTEFSVKASGLRPGGTQVTGWDHDQGRAVVGKNHGTGPESSSPFVEGFTSDHRLGTPSQTSTAVVTPNPETVSEAEQIASALYSEWRAASVVARGTCDVDATIKPLVEVQVNHAGPATGKYVVNEVEHTYTREGFHTRFLAGPRRPSGLVDTLAGPGADQGFTAAGLVIGNVTNIADPDKLGRVKVTYVGIAGEVESAWARIVTLGAGGKRGITFQPEVNDEVLVGFDRGDTRSPLILGGLYSKRHVMEDTGVAAGQVQHRRMTSRLGHVVELADGQAPADQHILLQLGTDQQARLRLGSDKFDIEMPAGKPLTITVGTAKIAIDSGANITMEGNNITLKAKNSVTLEGMQIEAKAGTSAKVEAVKLDLTASATATLSGGGTTTIKGGIVAIN